MSAGAPHGAEWNLYIDGLNFYSAVRDRPAAKWVDFAALASRLVPHHGTVASVKYFTAQISDKAAEDPGSPGRQRLLIRAVRASGVEVVEGKFKVPEGWRSISSRGDWEDRLRPPLPESVVRHFAAHFASHQARPWKARVELPQEKFTDVAIAAHLLRDFYRGGCSHAIVVSNDSIFAPRSNSLSPTGTTWACLAPWAPCPGIWTEWHLGRPRSAPTSSLSVRCRTMYTCRVPHGS